MDKLMATGRIFFAIGLAGLGLNHFILGDFVTGRAPAWPESIPGGLVWAYVTGAAFIATSIALIAGRNGRVAATAAAALIFLWALLRHVPIVAADSFLAPSWTGAGKALMLFGGALAVAGILPRMKGAQDRLFLKVVNLEGELVTLGRICLGIFFIITGSQHFIFTEFVASLLPAWFPGDAGFWTYFGGVALIAGGVGLLVPRAAALAGLLSGLMVLFWFWIIHVPRTFNSASDQIAVFEALAVSGIAFVIGGFMHAQRSPSPEVRPAMQQDADLGARV